MNDKTARRLALVGLASLLVYGLACWYPAAWSPDSQQVVFPQAGKDGITGLVLVDLEGKLVRQVARVTEEGSLLGPAGWSPDGKYLAYVRVDELPNPVAVPAAPDQAAEGKAEPQSVKMRRSRLLLQPAAGRDEQCLIDEKVLEEREDDAPQANLIVGLQWTRQPQTLSYRRSVGEDIVFVQLDVTGKVQGEVRMPRKLAGRTARLSPDASRVAWYQEDGEKTVALFVRDVKAETPRKLASMSFKDGGQMEFVPAPVWSADGQCVVGIGVQGDEVQVVSYVVATGEATVLWHRRESSVVSVSSSADGKWLAVDGMVAPDVRGVEVLAPGQASQLVFAVGKDAQYYSTCISPDGRWVALSPIVKDDQGQETMVGVILAADGSSLRFIAPTAPVPAVQREVIRQRLEAALRMVKLAQPEPADEEPKAKPTLAQDLTTLAQLAPKWPAPLFREALAYGQVRRCLDAIKDLPFEQRTDAVTRGRTALKELLAAYPGHALGGELANELDELAKPPAPEPKAPEPPAPAPKAP